MQLVKISPGSINSQLYPISQMSKNHGLISTMGNYGIYADGKISESSYSRIDRHIMYSILVNTTIIGIIVHRDQTVAAS